MTTNQPSRWLFLQHCRWRWDMMKKSTLNKSTILLIHTRDSVLVALHNASRATLAQPKQRPFVTSHQLRCNSPRVMTTTVMGKRRRWLLILLTNVFSELTTPKNERYITSQDYELNVKNPASVDDVGAPVLKSMKPSLTGKWTSWCRY